MLGVYPAPQRSLVRSILAAPQRSLVRSTLGRRRRNLLLLRRQLHHRIGLRDLHFGAMRERCDDRGLAAGIDMRAEQLGLRSGRVDEHELDAELGLEPGDLRGARVVLEIDQHVVRIDLRLRLRAGGVGSLLGQRRAGISVRAEVPPQKHHREDHEDPQQLRDAGAFRLLLVHVPSIGPKSGFARPTAMGLRRSTADCRSRDPPPRLRDSS